MGVAYKLTEEVLQFIIQRKTDNAKISCQDISDEILSQFELKVSKSSVYEALKHLGIVHPRKREAKDTFALPVSTKAKIMTGISKLAEDLIKQIDVSEKTAAPQISPPQVPEPKKAVSQSPTVRSQIYAKAGQNFENALCWEMGISKISEINEDNLKYLTFLVYAYKLEFKDLEPIYIDAQFIGLEEQFSALEYHARFLPRAIMEMCDRVISQIKPLEINDLGNTTLFLRLSNAFEIPDNLVKVSLLNTFGEEIVSFKDILMTKRMIAPCLKNAPIDVTKIDINNINSIVYDIFGKLMSEAEFLQVLDFEWFTIKSKNENVVNIIVPDDYKNYSLLEHICAQFSNLCLTQDGNIIQTMRLIRNSDV